MVLTGCQRGEATQRLSRRVTCVGAVVAPVHVVVVLLGRRDRPATRVVRSKVQSVHGIGQAALLRAQVVNLMITSSWLRIRIHTISRHSHIPPRLGFPRWGIGPYLICRTNTQPRHKPAETAVGRCAHQLSEVCIKPTANSDGLPMARARAKAMRRLTARSATSSWSRASGPHRRGADSPRCRAIFERQAERSRQRRTPCPWTGGRS